jgi:uracil-DNA glycosylase
MDKLIREISKCDICAPDLEYGARPVLAASSKSKIVIIGQAPGAIVHRTGIPWDDQSGNNLRKWLKIDNETFYNTGEVALLPMGFCYPGKGKSGDLPPRPECAPLWHEVLFRHMQQVRLILLIGKYAQDYYLRDKAKTSLTETVRNYLQYLPEYFVLPHPSPRNNIWQARNKWFGEQVIPTLQAKISEIIQ